MVSSRAKGYRTERKLIDHLTRQGWLVDRVEKKGKFLKNKDLFGLFDLVGVNRTMVCFIQVTTNRPHAHEPYSAFKVAHPNTIVEQWVWYDRKGWVQFLYWKDGTKTRRDWR